jgi:hypothetical protein
METTAIVTVAPSVNGGLSVVLGNFHEQLEAAAENNLAANLGEDLELYQPIERRALKVVESLRLLNGFDLFVVIERGRLLRQIETEGLATVFPGDANRIETIAEQLGISTAEFSDTRSLCDIIFPWMETHLGETSVAQTWDRVGKSKMRELVPVLRAIITGEDTGRESVQGSVELLLEAERTAILGETVIDVAALAPEERATLVAAIPIIELRTRAVDRAFELGTLPVREMRQQIRPNHTPNITTIAFRSEGNNEYVVMKLTPDQKLMFSRLLGTHIDLTPILFDPQSEIEFLPTLRQIVGETAEVVNA